MPLRYAPSRQLNSAFADIKTTIDEVILREFKSTDQNEARALILSGLGEHFGFIDEKLKKYLKVT